MSNQDHSWLQNLTSNFGPALPLLLFGTTFFLNYIQSKKIKNNDGPMYSFLNDDKLPTSSIKTQDFYTYFNLPRVQRNVLSPYSASSTTTSLNEELKNLLKYYDVDPENGFIPGEDPLLQLPEYFAPWENVAKQIPSILGLGQCQIRDVLLSLPLLDVKSLYGNERALRRAHLILCIFAHSFVWGIDVSREGSENKYHKYSDVIPANIAIPLWKVSKQLKLPPVLGHPSIVLNNWRKIDPEGEICMENVATLNNFLGGKDESWFYLITLDVEAKGAKAVVPIMLIMLAIETYKKHLDPTYTSPFLEKFNSSNITSGPPSSLEEIDTYLPLHFVNNHHSSSEAENYHNYERLLHYSIENLKKAKSSIDNMTTSINRMYEGCMPYIFYNRVRPFLPAWKQNPAMPFGVLYEGVDIDGNIVDEEKDPNEEPYDDFHSHNISLFPERIKDTDRASHASVDKLSHLTSEERKALQEKYKDYRQYFGGSAAQSSLLPFLDITLGVDHHNRFAPGSHPFSKLGGSCSYAGTGVNTENKESKCPFSKFLPSKSSTTCPVEKNVAAGSSPFLLDMRNYMFYTHREFLSFLELTTNIRQFVLIVNSQLKDLIGQLPSSTSMLMNNLIAHYDQTINSLKRFRSSHLDIVFKYIIQVQKDELRRIEENLHESAYTTKATELTPSSSQEDLPISSASAESVFTHSENDHEDDIVKRVGDKEAIVTSSEIDLVVNKLKGLGGSSGGKGTGGTDLLTFLKPLKDNVANKIINKSTKY